MKWLKTSTNQPTESLDHEVTDNGSRVTIKNVGADNGGRYVCQLTNGAGRATTSANVEVLTDEKVYRAYERAKK